jgi:hypothetical protein
VTEERGVPKPIDVESLHPELTYTVGTLVTDWDLYEAMVESFRSGGFREPDTEYLYIDNRGANRFDAYEGLNRLLARAKGAYVILVHQDVRLMEAGATELGEIIEELNADRPEWGVLGNAGGYAPGRVALRITDPHGGDQMVGDLPARVHSLDENFIVLKRDANLGFSRDLSGFHLYGTDVCLRAEQLGYSAYVVDFHLRHLSGGTIDEGFSRVQSAFIEKYRKASAGRWIQTPSTRFYISASSFRNRLARNRVAKRLARTLWRR